MHIVPRPAFLWAALVTPQMTPDQMKAVCTLAGDLVVRAGAGSGKTTVLAHRFAQSLSAPAPLEPLSPDEVLVISFTNKAAGEIAERVRRVVSRESGPATGRTIDDGWISTVHALCGRLLRRHPLESAIAPFFGTADEVATTAIQHEAYELAARPLLESDRAVRELLEGFSHAELRARVISCHGKVRALGLDISDLSIPLSHEELEPLLQAARLAIRRLSDALDQAAQTDSIVEKRARLAEWLAQFEACSLSDPTVCQQLVMLHQIYDIKHLSGRCNEANQALKEVLTKVGTSALAVSQSHLFGGLLTLIRRYADEYARLKTERGVLDYDDLQEQAVLLLQSHPNVARRYRERFKLIMVDEFQDTNELQMRVLAPLRNEDLCVVGDERQSIYGFRYADVEIFERLSARSSGLVELKDNFRSHPGVLNFVNEMFGLPHLFGSSFMRLNPRRSGGWILPLAEDAPRVECCFVSADDSSRGEARQAEASLLAGRVRELLDAGASPGDVALLLRAATHADVFAAALEAKGVPVVVTAGANLIECREVQEVMSLLRAVAVPDDDSALLSVLGGRIVGLSEDTLLAMRVCAARDSMWEGLARATAEDAPCDLDHDEAAAAAHAFRTISELARLQGRLRLAELVIEACEAFDFDVTLHAQGPSGVRAWGNVLKLARLAQGFEESQSNDPAEFIEHLRQRGEFGSDRVSPAEAGQDSLTIMTVHAAKGLEFPIVFAADLSSEKSRGVSPVLVEARKVGDRTIPVLGVSLPKEQFGSATTPAYHRMAEEQRRRDVDEEMRCLYVACTRAQELLVLSGSCALDQEADAGRGLIDWVREAAGDAEGTRLIGGVPVRVTSVRPEPEETEAGLRVAPFQGTAPLVVPTEGRQHVVLEAPLPRVFSYSALRRHAACPLSYRAAYVLGLPAPQAIEAPALALGSAVHALLQSSWPSPTGENRTENIARQFMLSDQQAREMRTAADAFLASALAERARAGDRTATEEPFAVAIGDRILSGSIDLISWAADEALIVDYKTGSAPSDDGSARDADYLLQAQCYALAALSSGAAHAEVVFAFVQHPGCERAFTFGKSDEADLRAELERRLRAVEEDTRSHLARYSPDVCATCPALGAVCPVQAPSAPRSR